MSMRDPPLLHQAAESGDIALVKQCLRAGADVNTPDPRGRERFARTPLHWACYGGHLEMVRLLLDAGADVQAKESNGTTPLRRVLCPSSKKVDWQRRIQTAELLISAGANVTDGGQTGETPLHLAAKANLLSLARLLLAHGADINAQTIMTRFRRFGALLRTIIDCSPPEVNVMTAEDIYALTSAYAKLGPRRDWLSRVTPLVLAAWNGHVDMVRFLLHEGANCNPDCDLTPLTAAVERQHLEVVRLLLESGAQVNSRNSLGETALHVAATSASTDEWVRHMGGDSFGGKATAPQLSILRLLLENSADAQARSKETPPPICWATDEDVIRILCEHGAVPEKLKCPAPRDWARDGVIAALSRGRPACFFTFCADFPHGLDPQTGHLLPFNLDETTGLPVHWVWGPQRSDQVQAVHGHNEGVWEWIKNHGLPWNSRKPWLKEITDPKRYVETEWALQRTFLLTEESKVLISPDGKTEVRFTSRPGLDAPIRSMLISSTKFFHLPGSYSPSLFAYQPDAFWPVPLNSKLPALGQSWSETPQSWPCSPSGFGSAQQIELVWGPPGSELIFFRMLTREEEALGLQEKFVMLDLPLAYWWDDVKLVTV